MNQQLLLVLVLIATIVGVGMTVPQVLRIQRTRDFDGVSGMWIGFGLAMNCWWTAYGYEAGLWSMIPVSVGAAVLYSAMIAQSLLFVGRSAARDLCLGAIGLGLIPVAALVLDGWETVGLVVGLFYAVQFCPAVVAAFRTQSPSGVSGWTWSMALVEALIWIVYAADQSDRALLIGGSGGTLMSVLILTRLLWLMKPTPTLTARPTFSS